MIPASHPSFRLLLAHQPGPSFVFLVQMRKLAALREVPWLPSDHTASKCRSWPSDLGSSVITLVCRWACLPSLFPSRVPQHQQGLCTISLPFPWPLSLPTSILHISRPQSLGLPLEQRKWGQDSLFKGPVFDNLPAHWNSFVLSKWMLVVLPWSFIDMDRAAKSSSHPACMFPAEMEQGNSDFSFQLSDCSQMSFPQCI